MSFLAEKLSNPDFRQLLFNLTGLIRRHIYAHHHTAEGLLELLEMVDSAILDISQWQAWILLDFPPFEEYRVAKYDFRKEFPELLKMANQELRENTAQ